VLDQLGWGELGALVLLALFVFGPERLPSVAADAGRALRHGRAWLHSLTAELKQDLGPELGDLGADLRQLRPTTMAAQLWEEDEGRARAPGPR
jgi:sec-independent protein translocase protein TatB